MKLITKLAIVAITISTSLIALSFSNDKRKRTTKTGNVTASAKIQVAILLDVSNSMDGLIEQAKAQLWNMVTVLGKAQNNHQSPEIEISLYEYGRSSNNAKDGYVKQITPFTSDLDFLSKELFKLTTQGGDEYCGNVIYTSLSQLNWDAASGSYKVIFIAGNEDFLQGDIQYTRACKEANSKGVIVNTIYCGDKMQGIKEHWNLAGECGNGSYSNINQDAKIEDIPTPYDSILFVLNDKLNKTYISYGYNGKANLEAQSEVDAMNYVMNKSVAAKRVAVKGKKQLYKNTAWDLVDAADSDSTFIAKVDMKTLPGNLQNKSRAELKEIVKEKNVERSKIQAEISSVNINRETFLVKERLKLSKGNNSASTMETEIEKIIKAQAGRYNIVFE